MTFWQKDRACSSSLAIRVTAERGLAFSETNATLCVDVWGTPLLRCVWMCGAPSGQWLVENVLHNVEEHMQQQHAWKKAFLKHVIQRHYKRKRHSSLPLWPIHPQPIHVVSLFIHSYSFFFYSVTFFLFIHSVWINVLQFEKWRLEESTQSRGDGPDSAGCFWCRQIRKQPKKHSLVKCVSVGLWRTLWLVRVRVVSVWAWDCLGPCGWSGLGFGFTPRLDWSRYQDPGLQPGHGGGCLKSAPSASQLNRRNRLSGPHAPTSPHVPAPASHHVTSICLDFSSKHFSSKSFEITHFWICL